MWTRRQTDDDRQPCRQPYSFYHDFMGEFWQGGPSEALGACMHRMCTLGRKMEVQSFLVEDGLARTDVAEEIAHLEERCEPVRDGWVSAAVVTFLRAPAERPVSVLAEPDFIGQMCIISFKGPKGPTSYIYEAVFRVPGKSKRDQLLNNHISLKCRLSFIVGTRRVRLLAAYFCQQNGITSICAHSAVRMLVRTRTGTHASTPSLNALWGFDRATSAVTSVQVQDALRRRGLNVATFDLSSIPKTLSTEASDNVWGLLALLADSGSPSLLMFSSKEGADHVVTLLGHTVNTDEWHPLGEVLHVNGEEHISSNSSWIDHLVIHDDMLGPYYCLSRSVLFPSRDERGLEPSLVITVLPDRAKLSPKLADTIGREVMSALIGQLAKDPRPQGRWWDFLRKSFERRIFRTTLIDSATYADMLLKGQRIDKVSKSNASRLTKALPELMWMVELSLPNLFLANRAKLGEVLIDATAEVSDDDSAWPVCAFRLPSVIGWDAEGEGRFRIAPWPQEGHTPMYAPTQHGNQW